MRRIDAIELSARDAPMLIDLGRTLGLFVLTAIAEIVGCYAASVVEPAR